MNEFSWSHWCINRCTVPDHDKEPYVKAHCVNRTETLQAEYLYQVVNMDHHSTGNTGLLMMMAGAFTKMIMKK